MRPTVVYVYPLNGQGHYFDLAARFIAGYNECPVGITHDLLVVCNGAPITDEARFLFGGIPNCKFMEHNNSGYDVGAFQRASREHPSELMVFFGAST